jgi:hypothetical protein
MKSASVYLLSILTTPIPTCATIASAHPGHPLGEADFSHLISSPDHAILLVGVGCLLYLAGGFISQKRIRNSLQWFAVALIASPLLLHEI